LVLCVELESRRRLDILCRSDGYCCTCHAEKCRDWQYDGEGSALYRVTKKRELLKNSTEIEEIQEKIFIDRN
jgi:hypothetical protein